MRLRACACARRGWRSCSAGRPQPCMHACSSVVSMRRRLSAQLPCLTRVCAESPMAYPLSQGQGHRAGLVPWCIPWDGLAPNPQLHGTESMGDGLRTACPIVSHAIWMAAAGSGGGIGMGHACCAWRWVMSGVCACAVGAWRASACDANIKTDPRELCIALCMCMCMCMSCTPHGWCVRPVHLGEGPHTYTPARLLDKPPRASHAVLTSRPPSCLPACMRADIRCRRGRRLLAAAAGRRREASAQRPIPSAAAGEPPMPLMWGHRTNILMGFAPMP